MLPVIKLGPLALPLPEFSLLIGFLAGTYLAERKSKTLFKDSSLIEKLLWTSLLTGITGARISYFVRHPAAFAGDYLSLISLNPNLLDLPAGFLVAAAVSVYLISRRELSAMRILDILTPFFSLMAGAVHLSRFASGAGFGMPTGLPWGISLWGAVRHPVQLYYLLGSILTLLFVLKYMSTNTYTQGSLFFRFVFFTCLYLLFFSRYQVTTTLLPAGIRPDQVAYWLGILISLSYLLFSSIPRNQDIIYDAQR
jgi:phosphatidylglycerol:prolipoprotein diacylglycerol transferase